MTCEEHEILETIAKEHGGYPDKSWSMNFSGHTFSDEANFSGLILIGSNFNNVRFKGKAVLFDKTRFYGQTEFKKATFEGIVHWHNARFNAPVSFAGSCFKQKALFIDVEFRSNASFIGVEFERGVMFNGSKFEEKYFPKNTTIPRLADFRNAKFMAETSFRRVLFGNDENAYSPGLKPERLADFSDAEFRATTDFRGAIFGGAPAFFNTTLHEDTDFGDVGWEKAETDRHWVDYTIRAWERLELIMSKLEKPLDRHQFFRLKMRARRRADGRFLRVCELVVRDDCRLWLGRRACFLLVAWPLDCCQSHPARKRLFRNNYCRMVEVVLGCAWNWVFQRPYLSLPDGERRVS